MFRKIIHLVNFVIIRRVKSLFRTFTRVILRSRRGVFSSTKMAEARIEACRKCDLFNEESGMCDVCGCIMTAKVKFKAARCALEDEGKESRWPI